MSYEGGSMISKSNAEALIGMIAENLTEFIAGNLTGGGDDLSLLFCRCIPECDEGVVDESECRACIERWLRAPYAGEFDFREGRIERVDP